MVVHYFRVYSTIDVRHLIKHKVRSYRTLYVLEHQPLHEVIHRTVISLVLLWIKIKQMPYVDHKCKHTRTIYQEQESIITIKRCGNHVGLCQLHQQILVTIGMKNIKQDAGLTGKFSSRQYQFHNLNISSLQDSYSHKSTLTLLSQTVRLNP